MGWFFSQVNKKASLEAFLRLPLRAVHLRWRGLLKLLSINPVNSSIISQMMPVPEQHKTAQTHSFACAGNRHYAPREIAENS